MERSLDVDEERRRELLDRIRYMATSGLYADHTAIDAQLSLNINYPLVSDALRMKFSRPTSTRCAAEFGRSTLIARQINTRSDQPVQVGVKGKKPGLLKR